MLKVIHETWNELARGEPGARAPGTTFPPPERAGVTLDFSGVFDEGSFGGTLFAGRIHYAAGATPTEQHASFALYDEWITPVVTIAIGGRILAAEGAAVYDGVFDGTAGHYDFVTMYGTGQLDQPGTSAFFELFFADEDASTLGGTQMPSARQLCAMPVKQVSLGTNAPGNVTSVGHFTLRQAA